MFITFSSDLYLHQIKNIYISPYFFQNESNGKLADDLEVVKYFPKLSKNMLVLAQKLRYKLSPYAVEQLKDAANYLKMKG